MSNAVRLASPGALRAHRPCHTGGPRRAAIAPDSERAALAMRSSADERPAGGGRCWNSSSSAIRRADARLAYARLLIADKR
jgi:hypothetical protein